MDANRLLEEIIKNMKLIKPDDIPNIDLYMDQVTTFMDKHLYCAKKPDDEKVLTKTMINNYAKNELLPSPEKKKYSKDHIMLLTIIYYFKNVLSISDIKKLLQPITDKYFHATSGTDLEDIYSEIESFMNSINDAATADVRDKYDVASRSFSDEAFSDVNHKDSEYLKLFSFISMLCFDIYLKKQLVEAIVDTLDEPLSKSEKEKLLKKEQSEREKAEKKARDEHNKAKK